MPTAMCASVISWAQRCLTPLRQIANMTVTLPYMDTVGGREIEFVAFLNVEEAVPAVNIAYDAIDTLTVQRMGVGFHLV